LKYVKKVDVRLARIVLAELVKAGNGLRRRDLEKRTLIKCGTRATFDSILAFLKAQGYIVKASEAHIAPYQITGKGKRFLEALSS
jgi:DNA-binding PadR family transcriptional regulator